MLPQQDPDNERDGAPIRAGRYGEAYTLPLVRKSHSIADEGSYFVVNNAQSGITTGTSSAFSATAPFFIISNSDSFGNSNQKRIYLDYLNLVTTTAGSAASGLVNIQMAIVIDNTLRFSSGGTVLTNNVVNPNMDAPAAKSVALVYAGALTATAASAAARTVVGMRILRPTVSGTVTDVVGETKNINFGGVEGSQNGSITVANANIIPVPAPPIIIGPGQSALVYIWFNNGATVVAAAYAVEAGWWER